jgi:hypothetical protein
LRRGLERIDFMNLTGHADRFSGHVSSIEYVEGELTSADERRLRGVRLGHSSNIKGDERISRRRVLTAIGVPRRSATVRLLLASAPGGGRLCPWHMPGTNHQAMSPLYAERIAGARRRGPTHERDGEFHLSLRSRDCLPPRAPAGHVLRPLISSPATGPTTVPKARGSRCSPE